MDEHEKLIEKLYGLAVKYAERKGYKLNPDKETVDSVIEGVAENIEEYGKRYCPCRFVSGDPEEDKKIICPCIYIEDEIENDGMCHCELFFRID
ncbi:ferredoxin-thioredoxin reductase catalytic domain-containing protein [Methanococcoides sp. FTZ1]|uniref:ferredoxin-thioredoxin reductase catalytic domain-containing protein n=1 Tax=Methanococcoides sp. FTZ1 TaxID=3439061 RepID=UPI003F834D9E